VILVGNSPFLFCLMLLCRLGDSRSIQNIGGVDLPAAAEVIFRRNRGIQAAKDIRECKTGTLDLSRRDLGYEGAMELLGELEVWVYLLRTGAFKLLWPGRQLVFFFFFFFFDIILWFIPNFFAHRRAPLKFLLKTTQWRNVLYTCLRLSTSEGGTSTSTLPSCRICVSTTICRWNCPDLSLDMTIPNADHFLSYQIHTHAINC
jgi:hypothetical protein